MKPASQRILIFRSPGCCNFPKKEKLLKQYIMKKIVFTCINAVFICCAISAQTGKEDAAFVKKSAEGGLMEVKLGQLALSHGKAPEVKQLGQTMIDDHSKANAELKELASRKNIQVPLTLTEKEQKAYDKLAKKQGKDFDKAYTHCMAKDHKKDVAEFRKEAEHGTDPELKAWASKTVPTLEHHLEMSKNTCQVVKNEQ
jgi:putative membrane protein